MLLDKTLVIFTDNKSLVNSFDKPFENHAPRQVRQLSYLSQFDCTLRHLPGHLNVVADCLSRVMIHHLFEHEQSPFFFRRATKRSAAAKAVGHSTELNPQATAHYTPRHTSNLLS